MASRYRTASQSRYPAELSTWKSNISVKNRSRYIEFKYLYFQIQKLLNKNVVLSFKYEQLKSPELRISLIKPLVQKIVDLCGDFTLKATQSPQLPAFQTPDHAQYSSQGGLFSSDSTESTVPISVVYVLLLLRYEYLIQSENNLIMYDLLVTKATISEFLAIRMLREYNSMDRINLLFINPMSQHDEHEQLKNTKHLDSFNTLELSILSKSKKFLSQPVIIAILDRIYNGELIMKDRSLMNNTNYNDSEASYPTHHTYEEAYLMSKQDYPADFENGNLVSEDVSIQDNEKSVVNYKFNQITMKKVFLRSNVVPKYQSLVINLKYGFLTLLFLTLVLKHKYKNSSAGIKISPVFSVLFWVVALSFNFDLIVKSLHIEYKFLKKIVWTYIDFLIVVLIDVSFVLRILLGLDKINSQTYYNCFSLISILLFPRMLSMFNNYEFFNMIVVSLKKMMWNVFAMFCLFISLIFGFFLCFISLTIDMSTYEVAFAMLKLFFGFTPAVWDNWNRYDNLGRAIQLAYLSLMQFVVTTILAIVLSNVFARVSETNKEEFEYLKTTNLIIYLKWAKFQATGKKESRILNVFDFVVKIFKFPIVLMIYGYEILVKNNKKLSQVQRKTLKNFTFLSREEDLYGDQDMILLSRFENDADANSLQLMSRRGSHVGATRLPSVGDHNSMFAGPGNIPESGHRKRKMPRKLIPQQSQNTIAGFRSGSLDSMFIDDFFGKKIGMGRLRNASELPSRVTQPERAEGRGLQASNKKVLRKLRELEEMISLLSPARPESRTAVESDDFVVHEYIKHDYCNTKSDGEEEEDDDDENSIDTNLSGGSADGFTDTDH